MDVDFALTSISGATFEEELGLQSANFPNFHCSLFPSVINIVRAMPPKRTPAHVIPVYNASGLLMPEHSAIAYPALVADDLVCTIANTEIVQWLINGNSPTLATKLAGATALASTTAARGYSRTSDEAVGQAFNTAPVAGGVRGGGGTAATNLLKRLAAPRGCFSVNLPPDCFLTAQEVVWNATATFYSGRAAIVVSRNLSRELCVFQRLSLCQKTGHRLAFRPVTPWAG